MTLLLLSALTVSAPAGESAIERIYPQDLALTFASADTATQAKVSVAPVYDNHPWALSARWDDNNANSVNMRRHMAKYGLKGTFYLTNGDAANKFGPEFCRQVAAGGFSVGGHSVSHPKLPELPLNEIWEQIIANRIQRECQVGAPLNTFAFPYGQYQSKERPEVLPAVTQSIVRAGFTHNVYTSFVTNNQELPAGEVSTSLQVVPGDRQVDATKFHEQLSKILDKWPDKYRETSHGIHLGVHPWQQGEEWDKLDAIFAELQAKGNFWYCNLTEWSAYTRQAGRATVEAVGGNGATRQFRVNRLDAGDLGADVPLTLVVTGAVQSATLDDQPLAARADGDVTVLNLPTSEAHGVPVKIGAIENAGHLATPTAETVATELPGLQAVLVKQEDGALKVAVSNQTGQALSDLHVVFRLPLRYAEGRFARAQESLAAGATTEFVLPAPSERQEADWRGGQQLLSAQFDFNTPDGRGRLWLTEQVD